MPSAALTGAVLGAVLLAGCQKQAADEHLVVVDITDSPAAMPPPVPGLPSTPVATPSAPLSAPNPSSTAPTAPPPPPYQHLEANGTEPFWAIEVLPGKLRFSSPEQLSGVTFAATSGDGLHFAGRMNGTPVTLVLAAGPCSDGMSERRYPYRATATLGSQVLRGCARAK